jgi:hypothetical protein
MEGSTLVWSDVHPAQTMTSQAAHNGKEVSCGEVLKSIFTVELVDLVVSLLRGGFLEG